MIGRDEETFNLEGDDCLTEKDLEELEDMLNKYVKEKREQIFFASDLTSSVIHKTETLLKYEMLDYLQTVYFGDLD